MKIVLAFDSFKGCMTAREACHAAAMGIQEAIEDAEILELPLSDGGEGLVTCVQHITDTTHVKVDVHGPLMEKITACYSITQNGKTAYMEMAAASGLTLVPKERRNPMLTTTYGVGEMIIDALRRGCNEIVMGIGGSATCDGGKGMLTALQDMGFFDKGWNIQNSTWGKCKFTVACDVRNPLYGKNGASYIFAPQKGATPEQVEALDKRLRDFAHETEKAGIASPDIALQAGTGAAGGLGYGMRAYLKAGLKSGIDIVLDLIHFDEAIRKAELVITGEGKSDHQTLMGKVPYGVLKRCQTRNIPVWLFSGAIDDKDNTLPQHFNLVCSINEKDSRPLPILMQTEVAQENIRRSMCEKIYLINQNNN